MTTPTYRVAARRDSAPRPGQRFLDTRGRTIEVTGVYREGDELAGVTVRIPIYSGGGRTQHWRPEKWQQEIAVGPLVDVEAVS